MYTCFPSRALLAALLCVAVSQACAQNLYRYKNDHGVVVIDDNVPPKYIPGGYEILSRGGQLLEVVPPQSEEVVEDESVIEERKREDSFILKSFGSVAEIRSAGERKLQLLEREIQLVESNINDTRKQRAREQARAANYQRSGQAVPDAVKDVLTQLDQQENKAKKILDERRREYADQQALYLKYESRYNELTAEQGSTAAHHESSS